MSDLVQLLFHACGEAIIHEVVKIFRQPVSDQLANLFCIKTAVIQAYIPTILNR